MPIDFTPPAYWDFNYRLFKEERPGWYRWWAGVTAPESDILDTEHLHAYRSRVVLRQGERVWEAWSGSSEEIVEEAFADDAPHCPMLWFQANPGSLEVEVYLHINLREWQEKAVIWEGNYAAHFTVQVPTSGEETDTVRLESTDQGIPLPVNPVMEASPPASTPVPLPDGFEPLYPIPGWGLWAASGKYKERKVVFFPEQNDQPGTSLSAFFTTGQVAEMEEKAGFFLSLLEQFARFEYTRSHSSGKMVFRAAQSSDNTTCWAILDLERQECTQLLFGTGHGYEVPMFSPSGKRLAYLSAWSEITVLDLEKGETLCRQLLPSPKPERIELAEHTLMFQEYKQVRGISLLDGSEATTPIPGVPSPFNYYSPAGLLAWVETLGLQGDDEYGVLYWLFLNSGQYGYVTFPMGGLPDRIRITHSGIELDFYRYQYQIDPLTSTVNKMAKSR